MRLARSGLLFGSLALAIAAACGTSNDSVFNGGGTDGGADGNGGGGNIPPPGFGDLDGGDPNSVGGPIKIEPADPVLTVTAGGPAQTTTFVARLISTNEAVPAIFAIDRGELGSVGVNDGVFEASGNVGGKGMITATWKGNTATTSVTVKLSIVENGSGGFPDGGADAGNGSGGNGGVGGHGPGGTVGSDVVAVLHGTPQDDNLKMLYPYDATVFPRGILAPLLMWQPGAQGDYEAVMIKLHETSFDYEGVFAANASPFQDHPISQQVWKQLTQSNQGEEVDVSITLAKAGVAYTVPPTKWKIASAPLKGVVYYNSYGTRLAKNYTGAKLPDGTTNGTFGGATLGIRGGSTDPFLVAGDDGDDTHCRVCHSVSADGSRLITQRRTGDKREFSAYDLKTSAETQLNPHDFGRSDTHTYAWSAVYPDGTIFLGDSSSAEGSVDNPNKVYATPSGGGTVQPPEVPSNWPANFRAAYPAFSPDGKNVAFTKFAGIAGADTRTLAIASFELSTADGGPSLATFGEIKELHRPDGSQAAIYPAFLPTNDGLIYQVVTRFNGRGTGYGETRGDGDSNSPDQLGTRGELWWVNAGGTAQPTRLDKLNGVGYLPTGPNQHDADATLNYEPTVNPIPSGGYAWVVFTSRRLYGNVATLNPFCSDPRYNDLTATPTPKKLWVAAIDLNAPAGSDPSHPAFYLPAQELLAGNSRGYWVVDPCKQDNDPAGCETGDECCGGFCRPNGQNKLVCSNVVPTCAQEFEKCKTSTDCCNSNQYQCINGRCAVPDPK